MTNLLKLYLFCQCIVIVKCYGRKIISGKLASIDAFPFMASVVYFPPNDENNFDCFCGGTILNPLWILTSAQCTYLSDTYQQFDDGIVSVVLGSTQCVNFEDNNLTQTIPIKKSMPYPTYYIYFDEYKKKLRIENDVGLLLLRNKITYHYNIQPVKLLPRKSLNETDEPEEIFGKQDCHAVGWGLTDDFKANPELRYVTLKMKRTKVCKLMLKNTISFSSDSTWCVGDNGKDVCRGDSGGPFMCNGFQIGIISGGKTCGDTNTPNLIARVDKFFDWIKYVSNKKIQITNNTGRSKSSNNFSHFHYILIFIYYMFTII